ncbi:TPA: hypothetical protein ACH3X1_006155, partial [Trebouxia sp. C0004]
NIRRSLLLDLLQSAVCRHTHLLSFAAILAVLPVLPNVLAELRVPTQLPLSASQALYTPNLHTPAASEVSVFFQGARG